MNTPGRNGINLIEGMDTVQMGINCYQRVKVSGNQFRQILRADPLTFMETPVLSHIGKIGSNQNQLLRPIIPERIGKK